MKPFQYMTVKNKPVLLRQSDPRGARMGQAEHRAPSSTITANLPNQCIPGLTATRRPSSHHIFWSGGSVTISQKQRFQGELAHYEKSDRAHQRNLLEAGFTWLLQTKSVDSACLVTASQAQVLVSVSLVAHARTHAHTPPANSKEKDLYRLIYFTPQFSNFL